MQKPNPPVGSMTFDELTALRDDPERFEAARRRLIDEAMQTYSHKAVDGLPSVEQFQFRIDAFKQTHKHPLVCMEHFHVWLLATQAQGAELLRDMTKNLVRTKQRVDTLVRTLSKSI